ncbi:MAG: hypothetical protein F2892_05725 [Actinobacteria bacterium]|uniref:Unannotated protein n=1 Tax=freshwater metagenome TaxID=449393 RepID=A0A6J7QG30_9ZZZZ|nr:hypothetical protein [Actinomycetota bacterium]
MVDNALSSWEFAGWATSPTGSVMFADGASYPFTTDAVLYARWAPTVRFWVTDSEPSEVRQNSLLPTALKSNTFTQPGLVFRGWTNKKYAASRPDADVVYADGATYPFTEPTNLYALWGWTVTFEANGGTGTMPVQTARAQTRLSTNEFSRSGYSFDGWATTPTGSRAYADNDWYNFNDTATLYARWSGVRFDANGGSGTMPGQGALAPSMLTRNAFTRSGYSFDGWATTPNGSRAYADNAVYPFPADATLYARWACTPLSVTVSGTRVSHNRAEVTFSASSSESPWTSFTANSTVDGETATVSQSSNRGKITVNGLRKNQGYRFTVTATNAAGCSYTSETTNRVEQWRNESVDSVLRF